MKHAIINGNLSNRSKAEKKSQTPSSRRLSLFVTLLFFLGCCIHASAQNVQYNNEAVDIGLRGAVKINPSTRGMEIQLTLGQYRGRAGLDVPVTLSYNSKLWNVEFQGYNTGSPPPHAIQPFTIVTANFAKHSIAGWTSSIGFPQLDFQPGNRIYDASGNPNVSGSCTAGCYVIDPMLVWMPDGSGHELRSSDQPRLTTAPVPDNYYAVDGSRMRYQRSTQILYLWDGSQYQFVGAKYVDRNGNTLTANNGFHDTLDRTINNPLPYNPGSGPLTATDQTYTLPGVGNTSITYTLKWRNLADVLTTPEPLRYIGDGGCPPGQGAFTPSLFQSDGSSQTCIGNAGVQFNPVVLSQIVLPNGQLYSFTYDIFGAINKVILPTGGYERFDYSYAVPVSSASNFKFVYAQGNRVVTQHVISASGLVGDEIAWLYSGGGNFVSVTAPDGSHTERYLWTDGVSAWGYSADSSRAGQAFDERSYSPAGQMLRRKLTDWVVTPSNASGNPPGTQSANRNARVAREVEFILDTSGPALAKTRTYNYDLTYQYDVGAERTAINEFDYVQVDQSTAQTLAIASLGSIPNGTLLRTTEFDYLTSDANYRSRNLLGLVTATRVKNGSGTVVGQISNSYDEAAFPLLTYASVVGWTDPGSNYRGNVTTGTTWLNFNGTAVSTFPQGTTLSTHTQYDQCGSIRKAWDAKDTSLTNPAQIDYSSTYQRAYPTTQTSSDPDGAGPLSVLTNSTEYDFSTGMVTAATDANGQKTTFSYNDPLNRLKQIIRASTDAIAKNQTSYAYDDLLRTVTITSDLTNYNDNILKTVRFYDGLARLIETRRYEDASNYISLQQQYDSLGRAFKVSNSFRPLQGESALWTTQTYDSLGRPLTRTTPDNAVVSNSYSGNTMTVTEQTGKQRKSVFDAFSRLSQVIEAPNDPNFNFITDYQYDTVDNLVKVTQGSQARYFMYDSLKRLIRSRNVEQGTNATLALTDPLTLNSSWSIAYEYDNNGNVTKRTDPRGVISTYTYDALNRNLSTSYSNDPTGTPSISHVYDLAVNGKGFVYQTQVSGLSQVTIDSYDALGRPLTQRQQFYASGAWGQSYTLQRAYNLAGAVTSVTYPSNRVVSYTYDGAGRQSSFSGTLGDGSNRTYTTEILYSSLGGLAKEKFGTTTPVYNKLFYNSRGQLAEIRESTSYTGPTDTNWNRGAIINSYSDQCTGVCSGSAMTDNNGNLKKQDIYIPNDDQISGSTLRSQLYDYDSLNRLNSAREVLNGAEQWKQQFTYDRWGNRTINNGVTYGTGINNKSFIVDPSNNRLGVPTGQSGVMSYDASGNLTNDTYTGAGNRTYDAENKITSAWGGNNQAQLYSYDGSGHRIKRMVDGVETWQIFGFEGELVAEYPANGAAASPQKEYGYRNGQLLITANAAPVTLTNVALPANGGTVTASSTMVNPPLTYPVGSVNNGDRKGVNAGSGGSWLSSTATVPQWVQVDFNGSKSVSEVDVFSLQDNYGSPIEPTETTTFSLYGLTTFDVQYWNGSAWTTVPGGSVSSNNKVWKRVSFAPISTSKIRVLINGTVDGWSRMVEVEAWAAVPSANVALSASGATVSASSTMVNPPFSYPVSATNNGDRKGLNAGTGGNWLSSTATFPQWVQVDFNGSKTISEVDVFSLQDNYGSPIEPTETTTFSLYGLTAFDVQYWNGSSWTTVPGGSVTGNNKVWKKVTFTPLTTSRIRVLISGSVDGYSRVVELEAWTPGASNINWLVTDHLGTPRMILDQTGSLANVKRHDYLPYGEEVLPPTGGRNATNGYSSDGIRQQFTAKERDVETGLDYFGARYYMSIQGRFTSPDAPFLDQVLDEPQSWNLYQYVANNPLRFIDPYGYWRMTPEGFIVWENQNDTWASLGSLIGADPKALQRFFQNTPLGPNTVLDIANFNANRGWDPKLNIEWTEQDEENYRRNNFIGLIESSPRDVDFYPPAGGGIVAAEEYIVASRAGNASKILRKSLTGAGAEAAEGEAAHHIVPVAARAGGFARSVLARFGIGINDAENGIFLEGAVHARIHTLRYYQAVNELLAQAQTREEAIAVLEYIKSEISKGSFPQ